jgi:phage terminase large subunit-like protein
VVRSKVWTARKGQKIDHLEVMAYLRDLAARFRLQGVAYDPRFFEVPAQTLADEGLPMIEVPQSQERMVPACLHAYGLIVGGEIAHDGDPVLAAHVNGAVRREGERGWTLSKGKSGRHIDACIAMVLALWEAATNRPEPPPPQLLF